MKKVLLVIMSLLILSSVVSAQELAEAGIQRATNYEIDCDHSDPSCTRVDRKNYDFVEAYGRNYYETCDPTLPECEGNPTHNERAHSRTIVPVINQISGNPSNKRWYRRDAVDSCWWKAGVGNVCMNEQYRREEWRRLRRTRFLNQLEDVQDTAGSVRNVDRAQELKYDNVYGSVERGPTSFGNTLGWRFAWRGTRTKLTPYSDSKN